MIPHQPQLYFVKLGLNSVGDTGPRSPQHVSIVTVNVLACNASLRLALLWLIDNPKLTFCAILSAVSAS